MSITFNTGLPNASEEMPSVIGTVFSQLKGKKPALTDYYALDAMQAFRVDNSVTATTLNNGWNYIFNQSWYFTDTTIGTHYKKLIDIPFYSQYGNDGAITLHILVYAKIVISSAGGIGGHYANVEWREGIFKTNSAELAETDNTLTVSRWSNIYNQSGIWSNQTAVFRNGFNVSVAIVPQIDRELENPSLNNIFVIAMQARAGDTTAEHYNANVYLGSTSSTYQSRDCRIGGEYVGGIIIDPVTLVTQVQGLLEIIETSSEVGDPSGPGGYGGGGWDKTSDSILMPSVPQIGMSATGFIHIYNPTISGLSGLGAELLPQLQFSPPSPVSAESSVMEQLMEIFNSTATWLANVPSIIANAQKIKMIDYVLDCHLIPVSPLTSGSDNIRVGWQTLNISAPVVTSDYVYATCGYLPLEEFYENFADYLSTARMFIPFVGFVSLQPEWFNNAGLTLSYIFNVIDGSFTAFLEGTPYKNSHLKSSTVLGQWGGSCCVHIPITGVNYSSMMSGAIGGTAGAIASAGSGNLAGAAMSAINAVSARGTVEQSNSYSASASFVGGREAYIQIERPISSYSANYQHELGIPANIYATLSSVSGFVQMKDVHLDGIPCTDEERAYIADALKKGIIV